MKNIIIILLIALLAAGGGWYYYSNVSKNKSETNTRPESKTQESDDADSNSTGKAGNLLDLINSNQNQQCTFSYTSEDGQDLSGETFISQGNMRSNYEMVQGDENITGSMIKNGDVMYIWGSNMPQGIKMKYDPENFTKSIAEDLEDSESESTTPIDPNLKIDYNCNNWAPDQAVFTPPSEVTFNDISAIMDKLQDNSTLENICATCEKLEGENRETCLEQLNCGN